jgi:hypothetical protein
VVLKHPQILRTLPLLVAVSLIALPAHAKYGGGSGTAQDPYQIATAADLIGLGETPADCDEHFALTVDIDSDPNLAGRKVFDKAVIAAGDLQGVQFPCTDVLQATPFGGVFDGRRQEGETRHWVCGGRRAPTCGRGTVTASLWEGESPCGSAAPVLSC